LGGVMGGFVLLTKFPFFLGLFWGVFGVVAIARDPSHLRPLSLAKKSGRALRGSNPRLLIR